MPVKKKVYLYPVSEITYKEGSNSYISNLITHLSKRYEIINKRNKKSSVGLLDALAKINQYDIIYFNWIEDLPHRRFGFLQIPLLILLLSLAKVLNIKIIWFVHNNVSHHKKYFIIKKFIINIIKSFADVILTHSNELKLTATRQKVFIFHHPIETHQPIVIKEPYQYDILIWGSVSPYKGITEFVDFVTSSSTLKVQRILIAGKFQSDAYYDYIINKKLSNIDIVNKMLSEEELIDVFTKCKYVLFTYNSSSVLSSASLSKTLSFGKETIGPNIGAFKELGSEGLLYNYDSFSSLEILLNNLKSGKTESINKPHLLNYISSTTWDNFANFLFNRIDNCFIKRRAINDTL